MGDIGNTDDLNRESTPIISIRRKRPYGVRPIWEIPTYYAESFFDLDNNEEGGMEMEAATKEIPGTVLALLALIAKDKEAHGGVLTVNSVSDMLGKLLEKMKALGSERVDVAIRPRPGGFYSETVDVTMGMLVCCSLGWVTKAPNGLNSFSYTDLGRKQEWRLLGEMLLEHPGLGELCRFLDLF